jgi:hypothetical protein
MPANEFEKQVQKQLDDFQLNPSASVWKKVEEQIRKKKRRRVIFFFLFSAAIVLLGYYAYYLLQSNQKPGVVQQTVESKNEQSITNEKNSSPAEIKAQPVTDQPKETSKQGSLTKEEIKQKKNNIPAVTNGLEISIDNPSAVRKNKPATKKKDETIAIEKKAPVIKNNDVESKLEITVTNNPPVKTPDEKTVKVPGTKDEITKDPLVEKDDQKNIAITKNVEPVKTDSVKTNDIVAPDDKKEVIAKKKTGKFQIRWGLDFSAGATSNQSEVFSLLKSSSADVYLNSNGGSAVSSPASGGLMFPRAIVSPSSIKPGLAFRIGVTGELKVSERSRLSAGIQYSYASNKIKIGSGVDTSLWVQQNNNYSRADRVYGGSLRYNHTNSYHFLSIPLQYHWQIIKSKKFPLQWNAGVSFNYLLATNTLLYSPSYGGIYYQNKDAINRMHFNISTGLSVRLKGKKGMEWVLGPEMYFDTRRLIKDTRYTRQYLLFSGINAKLFFNKKKNK